MSPLDDLPARDLEPDELARLVEDLAAQPELWAEHVAFTTGNRHYASLHRDGNVDVWLLCWTEEQDTGWHDHDLSSGAFHVVEGTLRETNLRVGGAHRVRIVGAGETVPFGPEHIHRLVANEPRAVSIHAYSPPLWRLGTYAIDEDGILRRESISYAEELRPIEA